MASTKNQPLEEVTDLFKALEKKFPYQSLGEDKWYLVVLASLCYIYPDHAATLYSYLISKPPYETSDSRKALIRRMREALVKTVSIQGVCKPLQAIYAIAKVERPEDKEYSCSRLEHWKSGPENRARGEKWLSAIYQQNEAASINPMAAHRDFEFITKEISYGFYLSDHSILGPIETELIVLSGIMIQNLPLLTAWHLRGARRVGIRKEDIELVQQCVEMVAEFGRICLEGTPRVDSIEHEI
ncbi:hypothetical protein F5884DRAFT_458510 [Xylogone sp. PMI_703]|nr:hypothetical protein F5884DRAFT_458510 [Xylogone sp. PMI_703]